MKVLLLSTYEKSGGAAIAASRLLQALRHNGVDATMMCRRNTRIWSKQSWTSIMERAVIWAFNGFTKKELWATDIALFGQDITHTREYKEADVIHLHWVNQGFLSLSNIRQFISDGKKVVWTMHDAWNTMGAYHIARQRRDNLLERWTWKRKKKLYSLDKIHFVTCSRWLMDEVRNSPLTDQLRVTSIPNPIDTELFAPMESKTHARRILFVAQDVNNPMKGMRYLDEAVRMLKGDDRVEVIALGRDIPYIDNEEEMVQLYNSVDAFVLPSLSENLPNTIMEAMACGVPCVAFDVGGIPEMIDHKENGFLARFQNVEDLANGIRYVLNPDNHERLGKAAREKVLERYSEKNVAQQYIEVYE